MYQTMLKFLLPEICITSMACVILIANVFFQKKAKYLAYILSLFSLGLAAAATIDIMPVISQHIFNDSYIVDKFSCILKLVLFLLLGFIFIYSRIYMTAREFLHGEFFALSLFALLGMMVLISSGNFLTVYLGLELLVLPLYAMIVMVKKQPKYTEAAMKYFIIGSLGAGLLLYGISLVYGATGSYAFVAVADAITGPATLKLGMVLVVVGVALEFGAVPFHMWLPDVYEGSPSSVTMIIGTIPKIAVFAMAYRLLTLAFPNLHADWQQLFMVMALLSAGLGNIVAIAQTNLKRMLAYSTIGHIGFILLGLFAAPQQGYIAPLFYTVTYAFMALAAFSMIMRLSNKGFEAELISDFRGLNARDPWLAFIMMLIMLSLAGVPPLVGFYAKFLILQSVVNAGYPWLAILALLFSVIGTFYYLRIIRVMYFEQPSEGQEALTSDGMSVTARALVSVNGLALLALGVLPGFLMYLCLLALQ
jgi:NADH-quinone oxidoreductase subunit N